VAEEHSSQHFCHWFQCWGCARVVVVLVVCGVSGVVAGGGGAGGGGGSERGGVERLEVCAESHCSVEVEVWVLVEQVEELFVLVHSYQFDLWFE